MALRQELASQIWSLAVPAWNTTREFDTQNQKKSLKALQRLNFFVKFLVFNIASFSVLWYNINKFTL